MSNKILQRKKSIFKMVLLFHACGLLFISYVNGWFGMRTPSVQEEKPLLQEKEIKNEKKIREKKVKDEVEKQITAVNKVYLPSQQVVEKQEEKIIEDVNKRPDKKAESPIERKDHLAFKEQPLPVNAEKKEKAVPEIPAVQPEVKPENTVYNKVEKSTAKQISLPAKREMAKENVETEKRFDFTDYTSNLINNYGIRDGEQIPLLLIDDHDNNELYKEGLQFYGYQIIARPKVRPERPYYFVINNLELVRIDEVCPYTGLFPSVLQEDHKLFKRLLYQPQFAEMPNLQYELFYAPLDTGMMAILECKLKLIVEEVRLTTNEISRMIGTFKEIGDSYILIIESIVTANGKRVNIDDPDNRITTAGRY
jgi:hypothetical protein